MNSQKREKLLAVSTSGKNSAKGFMGKVRSAFAAAIGAIETGYADARNAGLVETGGSAAFACWTLTQYRKSAKNEDWDELERSIVAKLADEVKVCISGGTVEMTIEKKF